MLPRPKRLSYEVVGRHGVFDVERHEIARSPEGTRTVHTLLMPDWVTIVAVTDGGDFVVVRQHRHGVDDETLETAGGIVDEGEDPAASALRELAEETGYRGLVAEPLGWVHPNPALQGNRCHLFLSRGVVDTGSLACDDDEHTVPVLLRPPELRAALEGGGVTHALSVVALYRALSRL